VSPAKAAAASEGTAAAGCARASSVTLTMVPRASAGSACRRTPSGDHRTGDGRLADAEVSGENAHPQTFASH
jgi:hypothetical protein